MSLSSSPLSKRVENIMKVSPSPVSIRNSKDDKVNNLVILPESKNEDNQSSGDENESSGDENQSSGDEDEPRTLTQVVIHPNELYDPNHLNNREKM